MLYNFSSRKCNFCPCQVFHKPAIKSAKYWPESSIQGCILVLTWSGVFQMVVIMWYLNFVFYKFGPKSNLWFQVMVPITCRLVRYENLLMILKSCEYFWNLAIDSRPNYISVHSINITQYSELSLAASYFFLVQIMVIFNLNLNLWPLTK